jgi:hypothetical protein
LAAILFLPFENQTNLSGFRMVDYLLTIWIPDRTFFTPKLDRFINKSHKKIFYSCQNGGPDIKWSGPA